MKELFGEQKQIIVYQVKEMLEMVINWETKNKYEIKDQDGNQVGYAAERSQGFFQAIVRNFLRTRRPMTIDFYELATETTK